MSVYVHRSVKSCWTVVGPIDMFTATVEFPPLYEVSFYRCRRFMKVPSTKNSKHGRLKYREYTKKKKKLVQNVGLLWLLRLLILERLVSYERSVKLSRAVALLNKTPPLVQPPRPFVWIESVMDHVTTERRGCKCELYPELQSCPCIPLIKDLLERNNDNNKKS